MKKIIPFSKEISFKTRIAEITDIEITHNLARTPLNTIEGNFLVNGTYKMTETSQVEEKFSHDLPFIIEVDEKYDLSDVKIKISDFFFEIVNEDTLKVNVEIELSEVNLKEQEKREELVRELTVPKEQEMDMETVIERCYDEEEDEEIENNINETIENNIEETIENNIDELFQEEIDPILENKREDQVIEIDPIDILDKEIAKSLEVETVPKTEQKNATLSKPITDIFTSINQDEDTFKAYYVYIVRENDTLESILAKYQTTKEDITPYNDLNDLKIGSKLIIPCSKDE